MEMIKSKLLVIQDTGSFNDRHVRLRNYENRFHPLFEHFVLFMDLIPIKRCLIVLFCPSISVLCTNVLGL